jgi:hypothetical protein
MVRGVPRVRPWSSAAAVPRLSPGCPVPGKTRPTAAPASADSPQPGRRRRPVHGLRAAATRHPQQHACRRTLRGHRFWPTSRPGRPKSAGPRPRQKRPHPSRRARPITSRTGSADSQTRKQPTDQGDTCGRQITTKHLPQHQLPSARGQMTPRLAPRQATHRRRVAAADRDPEASDEPSDNGARRRQTERDILRHQNRSDLRQSDPTRRHQTKPACMVRRRSMSRPGDSGGLVWCQPAWSRLAL